MSSVNTVRDFQALGCTDQLKCALGARVYSDLQCDKRITNLEKRYDCELNLIYLQGKRDETIVNFVPVLSSHPLNFIDIEKIQRRLSTAESKSSNITLAISDTSSNILYYQIDSGVLKKE